MGFINLQPTSRYYVGKYRLANNKWYAPAYLAATQLGVNYQLRAAFACRVVSNAANGHCGGLAWAHACAAIATGKAFGPYTPNYSTTYIQGCLKRTRPATWARWQAIAAAQGLQ